MCGIVGYISNNDKLHLGAKDHFMRYALALDTLRGQDSTGVITLNKRFTVTTLKTLMPGDVFVHSKEYKKRYKSGWAQIGHNRAATRGSIDVDNAHPFTFGDVTMVHNGTLTNGGRNMTTYDSTIGEVDSMQIAYALSQYPPEKAHLVLEQIDGSFALVWTDRRDESVNMVRNNDRPLHFTFNASKSIMWYMSDGHHLHSINKSFGSSDCKGQGIFEMDKGKILKFRKGTAKPEVIKYNPFVRPRSVYINQDLRTKPTTPTGGNVKGKTALERAGDSWKRSLESNTTAKPTNGNESGSLVVIAGKKRRVPSCMQKVLLSELSLSPDDVVQFTPCEAFSMPNGEYVVHGSMVHPEWGDTPWEMTVHNVKKVQYRAYRSQDWLVRPVGLSPAHTYDKTNSACLGQLVHCDWKSYKAACYPETDTASDADTEGDTIVPGPQGRDIRWDRLERLLEGGCINCGADLYKTDVTACVEVNNGQDLICGGCVLEQTEAASIVPTIN